ncbi:hypothetical protein M408DRAFT_334127 [Serendipita vermifera MAFF 305830]|uniref:Uncharacterized protein n=1 Tax=Serendipita vermifera MAFF 305830 TaxID=933852 RepID=A0A0C2WRB5_SERVB|nr:hypothetical protein M408DRAFT_334127 [Serendipita vermifera MAFF 305830]
MLDRSALCLTEWHTFDPYDNEAEVGESFKKEITVTFPNLQARITTFKCMYPSKTHLRRGLQNVTHLIGAASEYLHLLRAITHVTLIDETFESLHRFETGLTNLTFLELHLNSAHFGPLQTIHLPRLQYLVIFWEDAFGKAPIAWMVMPLLQRLEFRPYAISYCYWMVDDIRELFRSPKESHYQSDPSTLILGVPLNLDLLKKILYHSPSVQRLEIVLDSEEYASDEMVVSIFTQRMVDERFTESTEWVYSPHLIYLCILLPWARHDLGRWVRCAWKIVKARNHDMFEGVRVRWSDSSESEVLKEHILSMPAWEHLAIGD